jgi:hypothetical protein
MSAKLIQLIFCLLRLYQRSYERSAILVGFLLLKRINAHPQKQQGYTKSLLKFSAKRFCDEGHLLFFILLIKWKSHNELIWAMLT